MTISSLGPRPAALTVSQPARRAVPTTAEQPAPSMGAQAYPAYPGYPAYPAYPSYPPARPERSVWHGLGLIFKGLGEVGGAAASGLWTVGKAVAGVGLAVVGFAASALFMVAKGAWHVLAAVGQGLARGGRAIFDPGYDDYRRGYPGERPYPVDRAYPTQPGYPAYPPAPQGDTPWRLDLR